MEELGLLTIKNIYSTVNMDINQPECLNRSSEEGTVDNLIPAVKSKRGRYEKSG